MVVKKAVQYFLTVLLMGSCANQVALTGGEADKVPPEVLSADPINNSLNFREKRIEIVFDEFIQLRNTSEIFVSPYLDTDIKYSANGKKLTIAFDQDTEFQDSTTYEIFFGKSVVDLNEGNPKDGFTYRFSTGDVLDSLEAKGVLLDAVTGERKQGVLLGFYRYTPGAKQQVDSIKPLFVTKSIEGGVFDIRNLKKGKYWVRAFTDDNRDYIIQPNESFAFMEDPVFIDTNYSDTLELKLTENATNKPSISVNLEDRKYPILVSTKPLPADVLFRWVDGTPVDGGFGFDRDSFFLGDTLKSDEILMTRSDGGIDTIQVKKTTKKDRDIQKVSVSVLAKKNYANHFVLTPNSVLDSIKPSLFYLSKVDSSKHLIKSVVLRNNNSILIVADSLGEERQLSLTLDSGAIWSSGVANDSIGIPVNFHEKDGLGAIEFIVDSSIVFDGNQLICRLLRDNSEVIRTKRVKERSFSFQNLPPGSYTLKVIVDQNENGIWDANSLNPLRLHEPIFEFGTYKLQEGWDLLGNLIKPVR